MIFSKKPVAALTPEDLGIDLEEDSEGVSEVELLAAIDTNDLSDFAKKVAILVGQSTPHYELKRKSGILYSRVTLESGVAQLFRIEWLRKGLTNV